MHQLMTTKQLAEYFQVSTKYIHKMIADGVLKEGTHFINIHKSSNRGKAYRFKLDACIARFFVAN